MTPIETVDRVLVGAAGGAELAPAGGAGGAGSGRLTAAHSSPRIARSTDLRAAVRTHRGRTLDVLLAILAAGQLAVAAWLVPAGDAVATPGGARLAGTCWLRAVTGHECPTCGLTRSLVALAHGDLGSSLHWHPAGPLVGVAFTVLVVAVAAALVRRRRPLSEGPALRRIAPAFALLVVVLGLARPWGW